MPLIDPDEFRHATVSAAAEWRERGDGEMAAAFAALTLERVGFGMTPRERICWATVEGHKIGLAFDLMGGEYKRSFVVRQVRGAAPDLRPGRTASPGED